jgi:hypothetical protein
LVALQRATEPSAFRCIDKIIVAFNAEIDRTKLELDNEFAATSQAITRAVMALCAGNHGEYANAVYVGDQLDQQLHLSKIVSDYLRLKSILLTKGEVNASNFARPRFRQKRDIQDDQTNNRFVRAIGGRTLNPGPWGCSGI